MQCLSCDANYATKGLTKSGTTWSMAVNKNTCGRVKTQCYHYLKAQEDMSKNVKEINGKQMAIKKSGDFFDATDETLAAMDGTDAAAKKAAFDKRKKASDDLDIIAEGELDADYIEATFVLPPECTNPGKCQWICETFLSVEGVADAAITMGDAVQTEAELIKENNSDNRRRQRRMLAEVAMTYTSTTGYEPDTETTTMDDRSTEVTATFDEVYGAGNGVSGMVSSVLLLASFIFAYVR